MLALILIWLFVSVLAVAMVFAAAFFEAAFGNELGNGGALSPRWPPASVRLPRRMSSARGPKPAVESAVGCRIHREAMSGNQAEAGPVSITAPEAFRLAAFLRKTRPAIEIDAICERLEHNVELIGSGRLDPCRASCPLMDDKGNCIVYAVRPACCREGCVGNEQKPVYELNQALAIALPDPALAGRWRAGEKVFDGCPPSV